MQAWHDVKGWVQKVRCALPLFFCNNIFDTFDVEMLFGDRRVRTPDCRVGTRRPDLVWLKTKNDGRIPACHVRASRPDPRCGGCATGLWGKTRGPQRVPPWAAIEGCQTGPKLGSFHSQSLSHCTLDLAL